MDQKTSIPGIYKAGDGVLINKDNASLAAYKARKNRDKKVDTLASELQDLKCDMNEIKEMVQQLLTRM